MIKYSKILSIFIVSLSAQDLNVDGGMNVSGNINMENNQIKNIEAGTLLSWDLIGELI